MTKYSDHERLVAVILRSYRTPMTAQDIQASLFEDWNHNTHLRYVVKSIMGLVRKGQVHRALTVEGIKYSLTDEGEALAAEHAERLSNEEVVAQ